MDVERPRFLSIRKESSRHAPHSARSRRGCGQSSRELSLPAPNNTVLVILHIRHISLMDIEMAVKLLLQRNSHQILEAGIATIATIFV
jgi:hypothetical protein